MEEYLERIKTVLQSDAAPRAMLLGSSALLAIVVITDIVGARDRAPEVRETLRAVQSAREGAPTVPSVASVPRDLASEIQLAARMADDADEVEAAELLADDAAETERAEAEMTEEPAEDMAIEEAVEEAEPEVAEAEMTEEPADDAAAETEEVAEEELAETEDLTEEEIAETEMPAAEAAEDAATEEAEMAEAEPAEADPAETEATEAEGEAESTDVIAEAGGDMGDLSLIASADISNGQRVWRQCAACHVYEAEQNRGGPHLVNIVGREIGAAEGWRYSSALSDHGGVWSVESLLEWLENPDAYIPGNQMAFRGLRNEQDRIDVLGFLHDNRQD